MYVNASLSSSSVPSLSFPCCVHKSIRPSASLFLPPETERGSSTSGVCYTDQPRKGLGQSRHLSHFSSYFLHILWGPTQCREVHKVLEDGCREVITEMWTQPSRSLRSRGRSCRCPSARIKSSTLFLTCHLQHHPCFLKVFSPSSETVCLCLS